MKKSPTESPPKLGRYITVHKFEIVMTVLCVLITVSVNLALPYVLRLAVDELTEGTLTKTTLTRHISTYTGLALFVLYFSRQLRKIPLRLCHKVEYDIRRDLFRHLTRLDQEFFRHERTGDLMTRMSSDMTIVRDAIGQGLLQGIRTVAALALASAVMVWLNPLLAGLIFSLYLPVIILFFIILRILRKRQQDLQEHFSEVSNFCQESFAGIRCIKGFALEQRRNGQFRDLNRDLVFKNIQLQVPRQFLWPLMAFWFSVGVILILNVGGRQVIAGKTSVGIIVQFLQYLLYLQWPLLAMSWVLSLVQRGRVSWQRIQEIFAREPLIGDTAETDHEITAIDGEVELKKVSLDIDGRRVLHDIDLHVPAGKTLGITGPTGSGKTLLISLAARLMDATEGEVHIGGRPIRQIPLDLLRSRIGFAAQEPILFSRTLEHNIAFGLVDPKKQIIDWAAGVAHLQNEIEKFPDQYQTLLGERGVTLSGGQRQRTSISRAIARRPQILILDDVLSAVDTQTEAAIMGKLQPVMKERTCLLSSHRISTLRYADEIIVIENGRITQRGSHQELIEQPGYYAELNTLQQLEEQLEAGS